MMMIITHSSGWLMHSAHLREVVLPDSHLHVSGAKRGAADAQRALAHTLGLAVLAAAAQQLHLQHPAASSMS